jgi:hypothetical protein
LHTWSPDGDNDEEVEPSPGPSYARSVADVIPIDHIRRSRRLFRILVDQLGVDHFLGPAPRTVPRIDRARAEDAIDLAAEWIERRTGGRVDAASREVMERQLRRLLILHVAESLLALAQRDKASATTSSASDETA